MKLPIQRLKVRLRQMPPLTLTGMGMLYVLLVAITDTACPSAMSFSLFYLLGVTLVGWYSGSRRAVIAVSLASAIALALDELFRTDATLPTSVAAWNVASRLAVFLGTGWLTVEISRLTRNLERLVEERTGQWKAEAEQHKATSTRLAEALDRFEQVINNITEVFWLSDVTKNEMAYISPGYERIWGRKCADLYREPKSWAAALHPADRDGVFRRAQTDQADGSYDVEYRILRPDGAMRWIHDRAFPVRNEQGEVYRIAGLAQDITERKRTREVLQTQAAILENMAEGVVVTNEQGVIVQMNPASERIWGYERNEMLGQPVSVFSALPEPEATAAMEEVLAVVQAAGSWRGTFKNRRKDGATIFCEATISRLEVQGHRLIVAVEQDVTERLRGQDQLQMQARVLESMAEAMLMADETGMIVLTNPALDALLGYESGELTGKPLQMLTTFAPEAYRLRFKVAIEQPRAPELAVEEYVVRRKGGALIQVEARASGLRLGDRCFLVLVGQDITERKRAEQALRQSEESLRVFLDAVPEPAMLLDREGTILLANQALAQTLGLPEGEPVGQNAFGLIPPRVAETRKAMFDQVVRTRKAARYEDARAGRHFLNFESPVLDAAGNVTRVALFALDITSRKAVESALAKQEALYRTLFELSPNGILLEDTSGNILDVNQAICESSGYTRQELLRSNVRRFVPAEDQSTVEAHLAKLRAGPPQEHEVWNLRKSGERRLIRLNEKLITLPDGSQKILVVTSDITKRRRSELTKEVFLSLGTKLSAVRTPVEAARAIYATADHFWKWDAATLSLYSQESDWMESVPFCDVIDAQRREVAPVLSAHAPTARERRVMQEGAELILRKEGELQGAESIRFGDVSRPSASLMYVPMRREDQPIGVLSIQSYTPNAYTEEDLRTLQALADYCAGALDRIRAETALREAHDQLERRVQERTAELQAANRALGESEEKDRRLHESMMDGFVRTDMSGLITYYNPAFQALLGYTADELRTLTYKDVTPEKWHDFETGIVAKQLLPRGYSDLYEKEYRRKDGTIFPVELRTSLIRDAQGQPATMWAIVRDITDRKWAEEALRRTNAILQAINQGTDNLICLKDLQGKIILANPAMSRFLGKTQAEFIGTDDLDSLPDRHQAASIRENDRRIMTTGRSETVEEAIDQPDRQWYCLFTKSPYRDESGNIIGLIGVGVDITMRKRAEEALREARDMLEVRVKERTAELEAANAALRESEERYRSLVNNLNVGVYRNTSEPQGRFIQTNPALLRMHGYDSVAEFQKLRVADLYQDAGERKAFVAELLRQGAVVNYELRLKKKDGTPIYASINATIHRGPSGEPDWIDGMIEDITQRKQAEKSLRASEERYRALAESSPDAIFILDRDLKVQYVNQKGAALWRRAPKELIGLTQSELFPPEEAKLHCRVVAEVFETGQAVRQDALTTFPVGEQWIEIGLVPLFDEQGTVSSVMGTFRDITGRKRAERQLAEALDLNQKMIAASTMGIAAYKATGECVFANEAIARIVGGSVNEVLQGNFHRMKSLEGSELLRLAEEALSHGKAQLGEAYITTRFGKTVWLDCHVAPFVSNGRPHLLLMALDITERKRTEDAFKQAERLQRVILDTIPDPVWLKNAEGRFLACNQAFATFRGRPVESFLGKTLFDCVPPEAARSAREDTEVMTTRLSVVTEVPVTDAQGRARWLESIKSPLFNERDEVIGTVGIARDVTERRRLERHILEISDREQARIGQDIHDGLCQQLVSLAFDANSLQSALSGQGRPEVKTARRIADCLDQAITETRQLSRGLFPVRLETDGLPPALEELAKAAGARFKIQCRFHSQGPVAVQNAAIATHLYRIAQEALTNVIKHSQARNVSIRLKAGAKQIELRVEDDGAGLPPAKRTKATGMGLHIMDYRARAIGGTFHFGPGRRGGTVVSCCIPRGSS